MKRLAADYLVNELQHSAETDAACTLNTVDDNTKYLYVKHYTTSVDSNKAKIRTVSTYWNESVLI